MYICVYWSQQYTRQPSNKALPALMSLCDRIEAQWSRRLPNAHLQVNRFLLEKNESTREGS